MTANPRVSIVSLGCSRNDVDSEELAGRLTADGWNLVADGEATDLVLVNTCGFIEQAKKIQLTRFWKLVSFLPAMEK